MMIEVATVEVGTPYRLDTRPLVELLQPCDWDGADFRLETRYAHLGYPGAAVRIEITGRVAKRWNGALWVRARFEIVGDGEPSEFVGGWVRWGQCY